MTEQKQRTAIAEALGIVPTNESDTTRLYGRSDRPFLGAWETSRFGQKQWYGQIPDYPHNLNAMQSAVCSQKAEFQIEFAQRLRAHAERIGCMIHQVNCPDWAVIFVDIKRG